MKELVPAESCDQCYAMTEERVQSVYSDTITIDGYTRQIEACKPHAEPYIAVAALLSEYGYVPAVFRSKSGARKVGLDLTHRLGCPKCVRTFVSDGTLQRHLDQFHSDNVAPRPKNNVCGFELPDGTTCTKASTSVQGIVRHRSAAHGITTTKNAPAVSANGKPKESKVVNKHGLFTCGVHLADGTICAHTSTSAQGRGRHKLASHGIHSPAETEKSLARAAAKREETRKARLARRAEQERDRRARKKEAAASN